MSDMMPTALADETLRAQIINQLQTVFDPEIPVNIYDLGLIYRIDLREGPVVDIDMTLTAPGCPVAGTMPGMVQQAVQTGVPALRAVTVTLVWDPPWDRSRMSEAARVELNMF